MPPPTEEIFGRYRPPKREDYLSVFEGNPLVRAYAPPEEQERESVASLLGHGESVPGPSMNIYGDVLESPYRPPEAPPPGAEYTRPFEPSPMTGPTKRAERVGEATGEAIDPYETMVQGYLERLKQPVQVPKPPPLSPLQAMSVALNPERGAELLQRYREPYMRDLQQFMLQQQREQEGAGMAQEMMKHREQVELRKEQLRYQNYWKNWHVEQAAANAGNVNYNYTIPGMKETAQLWADYRNRLGRGGRGGGGAVTPEELAKEKEAYLNQIGDDLRVLMSQEAGAQWIDEAYAGRVKSFVADKEEELAAVQAMTPEEWGMYRQLDDEGKKYVRQLQRQRGQPNVNPVPFFTPQTGPPNYVERR